MSEKAYKTVVAGLLTALGVLLPLVTAHAFGVPGTVLLPMHFPVFLLGLVCGAPYGFFGGLIIPAISSLLTGMPVAYPMLPIMICELCTYGTVSGLVYSRFKKSAYPALLAALVCGRVVYGLVFWAFTAISGTEIAALSVKTAFITGLPGIAIQLALIPLAVRLIKLIPKKRR